MTEQINISVTDNAEEFLRQVEGFPAAMASSIAKTLDYQNELTLGHLVAQRLTGHGPFPVSEHRLGNVTDRLRTSVRRTDAEVSGNTIVSALGTNVKYAGAHEFGFTGIVEVREHRARHHALDVFRIREGRTAKGWELTGAMAETDSKRATRIAEGFVTVRAHQMHMKIPARAPIRTAIQDRAQEYSTAISGAIVNAWGGDN